MSDYAWFALKGTGYLALIGLACWWTQSGWPLFALLLAPEWKDCDCDKPERRQHVHQWEPLHGGDEEWPWGVEYCSDCGAMRDTRGRRAL